MPDTQTAQYRDICRDVHLQSCGIHKGGFCSNPLAHSPYETIKQPNEVPASPIEFFTWPI